MRTLASLSQQRRARGPLGPNWKKILKENVRPSVCDLKLKRTLVLQQDNDPKHTSKSTSERLKKNKKELVSNPESPRMCAYKLVTVKFKWWGLQNKVENFIHKLRRHGQVRGTSAADE
ncbi:hypothetical protein NFI96_015152 [Prochilodus magdalenae]|nr:hypothetical protein NFI96_015152 [Prochilodus magdalenae]